MDDFFKNWVDKNFNNLTSDQLGSFSMYSSINDRFINYTLRDIPLDTFLLFKSFYEIEYHEDEQSSDPYVFGSDDIQNRCESFKNPLKIEFGDTEKTFETFQEFLPKLNEILHRMYLNIINTSKTLKRNITVYRGIKVKEGEEVFYGNDCFLSCSFEKGIAERFGDDGIVFEINLPIGTQIVPIFICSQIPEYEILIISRGNLKVKNIIKTSDYKLMKCDFTISNEGVKEYKGIFLNKNPIDIKREIESFLEVRKIDKINMQDSSSDFYILGKTGRGPSGIAIDKDGNIYTCNGISNDVTKITPDGISSIFGKTGKKPSDIVIDNEGNIYTCNNGSNDVTKIVQDSEPIVVGKTGMGPKRIAIDNEGNIYTCNSVSGNVTLINKDVNVEVIKGISPEDMCVDNIGNIYICNTSPDTIIKITKDINERGKFVFKTHTFDVLGESPSGIVVDSMGNIYTCNNKSNDVTKISPDGILSIFGETGEGPIDMAIDKYDFIYTCNESNEVTQIINGRRPRVIGETKGYPSRIFINKNGDIYTCNKYIDSVSVWRK